MIERLQWALRYLQYGRLQTKARQTNFLLNSKLSKLLLLIIWKTWQSKCEEWFLVVRLLCMRPSFFFFLQVGLYLLSNTNMFYPPSNWVHKKKRNLRLLRILCAIFFSLYISPTQLMIFIPLTGNSKVYNDQRYELGGFNHVRLSVYHRELVPQFFK